MAYFYEICSSTNAVLMRDGGFSDFVIMIFPEKTQRVGRSPRDRLTVGGPTQPYHVEMVSAASEMLAAATCISADGCGLVVTVDHGLERKMVEPTGNPTRASNHTNK
jgi:hypothetical protein